MGTGLTALVAFAVMTGAQGSVDLAEILAPPPSADFTDAAGSENVLSGSFNAHRYAEWLAPTPPDVARLENIFNQEGFTRGYARSWFTLTSTKAPPGTNRHIWLIETVEEYGSAVGARSRYAGVVSYTKGGGDQFVREIETSIPSSFGAVIFSGASYFVMFVKGNDVYIVRMEAELDDMTAATVNQAQAQFDIAPADTIPPAQWSNPQPPRAPDEYANAKAKVIVEGSLLGLVVIGRFLLFVFHLRRHWT